MHATPTDVHHGATCDADLENALEVRATYSQKLRVKANIIACLCAKRLCFIITGCTGFWDVSLLLSWV